MSVSGKWLCLLSEAPSYVASYPSFPLWADWIHECCWDGLGWAEQRWLLLLNQVRIWQCVFLSAISWLTFGLPLSFFSDVSVHQWLMFPPRTWLIFHLQPASQLFSELSTGPHAWTQGSAQHNINPQWLMWFLESPKADLSHALVSTWIISHPVFLSPLSFFLCMFVSSL